MSVGDIGELSSYSVYHNSYNTPVCWVDGDRPSSCTDKLKSILVNTTINSVAGSIASRGSDKDLSIHDLEQLVYKVKNQQGLWDISTCTNSDMGVIYCVNKVSKSTLSNVSALNSLFDLHVSLGSTVDSQSWIGVDRSMKISNSTQDSTTLYSVHMLKQNIVQSHVTLLLAASSCQMATDTITYLMWTQKTWIMANLDDLVGVAEPDKAQAAFLTLSNLLQALGLPINSKK